MAFPYDHTRTTGDERTGAARSSGRLFRLDELDDYKVADGEPDVRGWTVRTADDRDIGEVTHLIVDPTALDVRYLEVEVKHELLGTKDDRNVLIPIGAARLDEDDDRVRVDRLSSASLRGAPTYDGSPLTSDREDTMRRFYGPAFTGARADEDYRDQNRFFARGRTDRRTERHITRSEEQLAVGKRPVKQGEVEVQKHVETEHVKKAVPVTHEEVRVERRPAGPGATAAPTVQDDEIHVPVMGEEVVVEKRVVPKEEVVIHKEAVRDTKTVEADLRKEKLDVDRNVDRNVDRDTDRERRADR
jgi:uncharacterized protein (TIGR02271 family)